jgi:hypothetical protein
MRDVTVKIGGKKRTLKYTKDVYYKVGEILGKSWLQEENLSAKVIGALLWAGLLCEDPNLDLAEVEKAMGEINRKKLRKLQKAIKRALLNYSQKLDQGIKRVSEIRGKVDELGKTLDTLKKDI